MNPGRLSGIRIALPATLDAFMSRYSELLTALDAAGLAAATRYQVELAYEELVGNVVRHGTIAGQGVEIVVSIDIQADYVEVTIDDNGIAFDPREHPDALPGSLEEATLGGRGITMVRRAAAAFDYERSAEGHNILKMRFNPPTASGGSFK